MAEVDRGLKQRMVGALVLLALAIIFVPMLFTRQDEIRHVVVEAPPMPEPAPAPEISLETTDSAPGQEPPAEPIQENPQPTDPSVEPVETPTSPPVPVPAPAVPPAQPVAPPAEQVAEPAVPASPAPQPEVASRLDKDGLPLSWSVQLASLSNRASAETLQQTLRGDGYSAYIRTVGGMNRVFVGPVIERAEADKLRDQLNRQRKLDGFVVRFKPEAG